MKIESFDVLGTSLLVRRIKPSKVGALHIPDKFGGQLAKARIEAAGPDVTRCKPGDYVIFSPEAKTIQCDPGDEELFLVEKDAWVVALVTYADESALVTASGATIQ